VRRLWTKRRIAPACRPVQGNSDAGLGALVMNVTVGARNSALIPLDCKASRAGRRSASRPGHTLGLPREPRPNNAAASPIPGTSAASR
jgi:hypothetical protein